jgi:phosphoglycerol transferase
VLVLLVAWLSLGGVHWRAGVPFAFDGDGLFFLAQSKSTIDHGWWWNNPSLGAPTGLHAVTFAQNGNVDQVIVGITGIFTRDAPLAVNVAWLIMLALSALSATWGLRRLGASRAGAGVAAILFALTPFAIYRSTGHFNLVTYLLPIPATTAVWLASMERKESWRGRDLVAPLAGCALVGFNYIYFAFFGAFVIVIGAIVGAGRLRSWAPLKVGGVCVAVLILATTLNLAPNVLAWQHYGRPAGVAHTAAEADVYGLKIRQIVAPVRDHWFPPFAAWFARDVDAHFPDDNENRTARLGLVGSLGFVGLLAALLVGGAAGPKDDGHARLDRIRATALLIVAILLLATVGGFGSLFSLLISSDIRAYNRISPFIAYLVLAGVALWGDRVMAAVSSRWRTGFWIAVLSVGLADQQSMFRQLNAERSASAAEFDRVSTFMTALESQLPVGAMVYQLPVVPYPLDPGIERLGLYEQFRPYVTTHRLRWSYPALTRDQLVWEGAVAQVGETNLPRYLAREGFSVILVSRAGYADRGSHLEQVLQGPAAGATLLASNDDYLALDLRSLRQAVAR